MAHGSGFRETGSEAGELWDFMLWQFSARFRRHNLVYTVRASQPASARS